MLPPLLLLQGLFGLLSVGIDDGQFPVTGDDLIQPGRYDPTAFVTEQGVALKCGRNRQQHTEGSIEALRAYLSRHRPLHAELRGTFVAV